MSRLKLTHAQKDYRRKRKEKDRKTKRLARGGTRPARTNINVRISVEAKDHLKTLVIDRMIAQGPMITQMIYRTIPKHEDPTPYDGLRRASRRFGDRVPLVVPIDNGALQRLREHSMVTGIAQGEIVEAMILSHKLERTPISASEAFYKHFREKPKTPANWQYPFSQYWDEFEDDD